MWRHHLQAISGGKISMNEAFTRQVRHSLCYLKAIAYEIAHCKILKRNHKKVEESFQSE